MAKTGSRTALVARYDRTVEAERDVRKDLATSRRELEAAAERDIAAIARAALDGEGAPNLVEDDTRAEVERLAKIAKGLARAVEIAERDVATLAAQGLDPGACLFPRVQATTPDARPTGDEMYGRHEAVVIASNAKLAADVDRDEQKRAYNAALHAREQAKIEWVRSRPSSQDAGNREAAFRASEHLTEEQMEALNPRAYAGQSPRLAETANRIPGVDLNAAREDAEEAHAQRLREATSTHEQEVPA